MYQVPHKSSISEKRPRVPAWNPSDSDCTWSHDIKSMKTHCGTFFAWLPQTSTRLECKSARNSIVSWFARNVKFQRTLLSYGVSPNVKMQGTLLSAGVSPNVKV